MNGKQSLVALIGVLLVVLSLRQDWRPELNAVVFG